MTQPDPPPLEAQLDEIERKWQRGWGAATPLFRETLRIARQALARPVAPEQVGSGRRHGHKPEAGTMERRLYDATHHPTHWEQPDPNNVAALICWYRTLPGCATGGSLHIVIEDNNCDDSHVQWCSGYASGVGDTCGAELAGLLERMPVYDRVQAVMAADDPTPYVAGMAAGSLVFIDDPL